MLQPVVEDPVPTSTSRVLQNRIQKEISHTSHTERYKEEPQQMRFSSEDSIRDYVYVFRVGYEFSPYSAYLSNRHRREPEAIYLTSWDSTDSVSFKSHLAVTNQVPHGILGYITIR